MDDIAEFLPAGWEADDDAAVLICPHGNAIEPDGVCPEGCVSPLLAAGLI
jgi:hypothetical protein